jgi:hypothetical protein
VCAGNAHAQYDRMRMVALDSLENSLKKFQNQQWTAQRQAYQYKLKGSWTKAVPHIGVTLGLPTISWSPNQLFDIGNNKRQLQAKLKSLDLEHTNLLNKSIADLRIEYQKIQVRLQQLAQDQELLEIKAQIFAIAEQQNKNHEILPADYLSKKLEFSQAKNGVEKSKTDLLIAILELYKNASYNLPNKEIFYRPDETCILLSTPNPLLELPNRTAATQPNRSTTPKD